MKKLIILLLVCSFCLGLAACGSSTETSSESATPASSEPATSGNSPNLRPPPRERRFQSGGNHFVSGW
jgi:ABC-type phosphate transport system substrate-binding protein